MTLNFGSDQPWVGKCAFGAFKSSLTKSAFAIGLSAFLWIGTKVDAQLVESPASAQAVVPAVGAESVEVADAKPIAKVSVEHVRKNKLEPYVKSSEHWGAEIARLAAKNASEGGEDKVLLLGSSSIRLWETADADLGSWKTVRRGYGGAKFCDAAMFTPNLVEGLDYQGAVVFVANDITGGAHDKSPEEVARLAAVVVEAIQARKPKTPVLLMSITATPSRFKAWPAIEQANQELAKLASSLENVHFLDTKSSYLDEAGQPIPDYFVQDMLHQNASGYKLWGKLIAEKLASIEGFTPSTN